MKNIALIFVLLLCLTGCTSSQSQQQKKAIENVDAKRFKELVDAGEGIVLDVRTPEEFSEGYIPNAANIDIYQNNFEARIKEMDNSREIYVYCQAGARSADASKILQKNGFTKIYNLQSGFSGWKKSGYPVIN